MPKPKVTLSFAPEDETWADRVRVALTCLGHQERLDCWDPRDTAISDDPNESIRYHLDEASLAVLLISPSYLTCERVKEVDVPALLRRREARSLRLVFLYVRPCPWRTVQWIEDTQMFPPGDRALSGGTDHQIDLDLTNLAYEVNDLLP